MWVIAWGSRPIIRHSQRRILIFFYSSFLWARLRWLRVTLFFFMEWRGKLSASGCLASESLALIRSPLPIAEHYCAGSLPGSPPFLDWVFFGSSLVGKKEDGMIFWPVPG